jgi:hypothetical protein
MIFKSVSRKTLKENQNIVKAKSKLIFKISRVKKTKKLFHLNLS